jgi:6-phosphogluconate dehydrogenase
LDITTHVLGAKDENGDDLIDKIDFGAGAKGTGKWTVEAGMDLGIAVPNVFAGLNSRVMSARTHNFGVEKHDYKISKKEFKFDFEVLNNLLETAYLTSYLQGLDLIMEANKVFNWQIDITEVCRIWQGGCIIRSGWLNELPDLVVNGIELTEILLKYRDSSLDNLKYLNTKSNLELPLSVIHSSVDYLISLLSSSLPQNLTQAQRDFFGAHTYKRTDKEGVFTGGWSN